MKINIIKLNDAVCSVSIVIIVVDLMAILLEISYLINV